MKPILVIAIAGVAAAAMGSGALGNNIDLWVQQFGVGETIITTPVTHATVDFVIFKSTLPSGFFKNLISECEIRTDTVGTSNPSTPGKESEVICKLTDENRNIIAEGKTTQLIFPAGVPIIVPITQGNADIQDVHDVKVVIHANTYSPMP